MTIRTLAPCLTLLISACADEVAPPQLSAAIRTCRPFVRPADCPSPTGHDLPDELRCTGLYSDFDAREIACEVQLYQPAYQLWSNGATKRRFVSLPDDTTIDVSDPNGFSYPVGARFWKEFTIEIQGDKKLAETRMIEKAGDGWHYTTYVWTQDGSRALRNDDGVDDLFDSDHDVPEHEKCAQCHEGRADFVLGWDPLLLGPGASGVTRAELQAAGRFTSAGKPITLPEINVPGDAVERAALGYLHVNCGVSCHNPTAKDRLPIFLRLESGHSTNVQDTAAVKTAVNQTPGFLAQLFTLGQGGPYYDIRPGDPARSMIIARMSAPYDPLRMPRLGSEIVDPDGVRAVSEWISGMTVARGYPAPAP